MGGGMGGNPMMGGGMGGMGGLQQQNMNMMN